jgi:hypothetical protein
MPNIMKEILTLSQEGNIQPTHTIVLTEYPNLQISDIVDEWVNRESILYASVLRDRLSPNCSGTYDEKLYKGDEMRGQWAKIYVQYTTSALMQIRFYNCGFIKSLGHTT